MLMNFNLKLYVRVGGGAGVRSNNGVSGGSGIVVIKNN